MLLFKYGKNKLLVFVCKFIISIKSKKGVLTVFDKWQDQKFKQIIFLIDVRLRASFLNFALTNFPFCQISFNYYRTILLTRSLQEK